MIEGVYHMRCDVTMIEIAVSIELNVPKISSITLWNSLAVVDNISLEIVSRFLFYISELNFTWETIFLISEYHFSYALLFKSAHEGATIQFLRKKIQCFWFNSKKKQKNNYENKTIYIREIEVDLLSIWEGYRSLAFIQNLLCKNIFRRFT